MTPSLIAFTLSTSRALPIMLAFVALETVRFDKERRSPRKASRKAKSLQRASSPAELRREGALVAFRRPLKLIHCTPGPVMTQLRLRKIRPRSQPNLLSKRGKVARPGE
jgi:hypothetical protein